MKRNSDLWNTWSSCVMQMLKRQTRVKEMRHENMFNKINTVPILFLIDLTHLSLASLLWDIGKQNSPRCDAAERGVSSGAILFAWRIFIEKLYRIEKSLLTPLKMKVD